ncbi:MAG: hypothetical protein ABI451_13455 [Dokdonella sp.]
MTLQPRRKVAHYRGMASLETTKQARSVRVRSLIAGVVAIAASVAATSPWAAMDADTMALSVTDPATAPSRFSSPALTLRGTWPDDCLPRVDQATLNGDELSIHIRTATLHCVQQQTSYELTFYPTLQNGSRPSSDTAWNAYIFLARGDAAEVLAGFNLIAPTAATTRRLSIPENGFWWSSRPDQTGGVLAGGGIGLELQGKRLAISLLGFDSTGKATWFFGSGALDQDISEIPLIRLSNANGSGSENSAAAAMPVSTSIESGPVLYLEFLGPIETRAWLVRPASSSGDALVVRAFNLRRPMFDAGAPGSAWRGRWVFVDSGKTAQTIDLQALGTDDADSFRISESDSSNALGCRFSGNGSAAQISGCTLTKENEIIANFDRIGLDRLSGFTPAGDPVQLLRVAN